MLTQLEVSVRDVVTPGRLAGFGCGCAALLDVARSLTGDAGAFKVPHLASIPAKAEAEREPVGGGNVGEEAGYQKKKKNPVACLDLAAFVSQSQGANYTFTGCSLPGGEPGTGLGPHPTGLQHYTF